MRKKVVVLFAAAIAGMLALTACTSSEEGIVQSSGTQDGDIDTQAGIQSIAEAQTGSEDVSGAVSDTGGSQTAADIGNTQTGEGQEAVSGTELNAPEEGGGPAEGGEPAGDVIPDEDAQAAENDPVDPALSEAADQEDEWSGTYASDEETVTLALVDEESLSFAFAGSRISGLAVVKGHQAVYNGDDYHVVVFNLDGDTVDVSVSSEEDFDASASPLIGHYVKEQPKTAEN